MAIDIQTKISLKPDYETVMIVSPDMNDSEYKARVKKFLDMLQKADGEIINVEYWGSQKLAYPIQRKTSGYYAYFEFKSDPQFIGKMEQEFIYDEQVLRYLTVKLDKHAVAYNNKRRAQRAAQRDSK